MLRRCASVRINENGDAENIGSIARSWNPALHPESTYPDHYYRCKAELESLPWHVVADPRNPKDCEYPSENGTYVTMLDCNEHEVLTNHFRDGFWTLYHKTHVKWWMKLPDADNTDEGAAENVAGHSTATGRNGDGNDGDAGIASAVVTFLAAATVFVLIGISVVLSVQGVPSWCVVLVDAIIGISLLLIGNKVWNTLKGI